MTAKTKTTRAPALAAGKAATATKPAAAAKAASKAATAAKAATRKPRAPAVAKAAEAAPAPAKRQTRADLLIGMMRAEAGASAAEMGAAAGWQLHSVRGFVAGTLRKRADIVVSTTRTDGVTRYFVQDAPSAEAAPAEAPTSEALQPVA